MWQERYKSAHFAWRHGKEIASSPLTASVSSPISDKSILAMLAVIVVQTVSMGISLRPLSVNYLLVSLVGVVSFIWFLSVIKHREKFVKKCSSFRSRRKIEII